MQGQTEQLTLGEVSDRLDRLPASRFHAKILIVAAMSLLFDTLDTAVTGFVLASLRTVWHFDAKTIRPRLGHRAVRLSRGLRHLWLYCRSCRSKEDDPVHFDFVLRLLCVPGII